MQSLATGAALVAALVAAGPALAATGTWTGGAGAAWDTSANNWSGVTSPAWNQANGTNNAAVFNTAGATPTVSDTVYANKITFSNTATISGSGTITLGKKGATNPSITAVSNATISSVLAGTAGTTTATKDGSGTLLLTTATSPYSGALTVSAGELSLASGCIFTNVQSIIPSAAGATVRLTGGIVTNKPTGVLNINYGSFIQKRHKRVRNGRHILGQRGCRQYSLSD
jgi:fibronectin-binding autotransporter adhesin